MNLLQKLKALDDRLTPGDWDCNNQIIYKSPYGDSLLAGIILVGKGRDFQHVKNLEAITELRNSLPQLIQRLEDADRMAEYCSWKPNGECEDAIHPARKYCEKWMGEK